jgi:predicted MPP superfamily phosphohydrolase
MKIRYLHLSDLHLTSIENKGPVEAFNQDLVTRSLIDAVGALELPIDFIIITGDIARNGQDQEYDVCEIFCRELLNTTRLNPEQLFIVPGNHDVARSLECNLMIRFMASQNYPSGSSSFALFGKRAFHQHLEVALGRALGDMGMPASPPSVMPNSRVTLSTLVAAKSLKAARV